MFHHGSMWLLLDCGPGCPADKTVDCVTALWLVQRELVALSVKFVAAILQPVWPRDQYLTPARGAHLVGSVSVDKLPPTRRIGAKSSTNLDDHCLLISGTSLARQSTDALPVIIDQFRADFAEAEFDQLWVVEERAVCNLASELR